MKIALGLIESGGKKWEKVKKGCGKDCE